MYVQPFPNDLTHLPTALTIMGAFALLGLFLAYDAARKRRHVVQIARDAFAVEPRCVRWRDVWAATPVLGIMLWWALVLFWFLLVLPIGTLVMTYLITG